VLYGTKKTLAYYVVDGGSAFCTFSDATKAFDRIDYCKLSRKLLHPDLPAIYVRLLCNLYTNNVAHVLCVMVCGVKSLPLRMA